MIYKDVVVFKSKEKDTVEETIHNSPTDAIIYAEKLVGVSLNDLGILAKSTNNEFVRITVGQDLLFIGKKFIGTCSCCKAKRVILHHYHYETDLHLCRTCFESVSRNKAYT